MSLISFLSSMDERHWIFHPIVWWVLVCDTAYLLLDWIWHCCRTLNYLFVIESASINAWHGIFICKLFFAFNLIRISYEWNFLSFYLCGLNSRYFFVRYESVGFFFQFGYNTIKENAQVNIYLFKWLMISRLEFFFLIFCCQIVYTYDQIVVITTTVIH